MSAGDLRTGAHRDAVPAQAGPSRARRLEPAVPGVLAVLVWAALTLAGALVRPHLAEHALDVRTQTLTLAVGVTGCLLAAGWTAWRGLGPRGAGVLLGLLAGWLSFTVLVTLSGTPFGLGGTASDCGRTIAAAERYTTTWHSADQFLKGLPGQYPPLYFWLWGRFAALRGADAWQVMSQYQGIVVGLAPLLSGVLWTRVTRSWVRGLAAAAAASAGLLALVGLNPCKGHEASAFLLGVPVLLWASDEVAGVLAGSGPRWRRAVGWGVCLGLVLTVYQLPVLFGLPPLLVLWAVWAARQGAWTRVVAHVAVAGAAALLASAWYVLPLVSAWLTRRPGPRAKDLLMVRAALDAAPGPLPVTGLVLALAGLVALTLTLRRLPFTGAQSVLAVAVGMLVVQTAALWNVVRGQETFYSYRTLLLTVVLLGGALAWFAEPAALALRATGLPARRVVPAALALVLAPPLVHTYWEKVHAPIVPHETAVPGYVEEHARLAPSLAYTSRLPGCGTVPGFQPPLRPLDCYPATVVRRCVERAQGPGARPVLLSYDDRASEFDPYFQVLPTNSGATGPLDDWDARFAWVRHLSTLPPDRFTAQALSGPFGRVSGFVLSKASDGRLTWVAARYYGKDVLHFSRDQFAGPGWTVCQTPDVFVAVHAPGA
ncbi:MAG TPA: arabinofuranosyltransferase [Motilibacteraceae bacterium]|nr:arabinofuranosyltransferase [Motilibacteraceae bacterium]